jgi:hypothetical protein
MKNSPNDVNADLSPDIFLAASLVVLGINLISQEVAFLVQLAMAVYAVTRLDVRYLPSLFVLLLDKSNFPIFETSDYYKIQLGVTLSVQYITVMFITLLVFFKWFLGKFDRYTSLLLLTFPVCFLVALLVSFPMRNVVSHWQVPLSYTLATMYYYYGILIGESWECGKLYFVKRLILVMAIVCVLSFAKLFNVHNFSYNITMLCLTLTCFFVKNLRGYIPLAVFGSLFAVLYAIFFRYLEVKEKVGYSENSELGSTFTTVGVVTLGVMFSLYFLLGRPNETRGKRIPGLALLCCGFIVVYSSMRYMVLKGAGYDNQYRIWIERFEYKLVYDRGGVWSQGIEDAFTPPFILKDLRDQVALTTDNDLGIKLLPHNQLLTLIVTQGWLLGGLLSIFLWIMHKRSFDVCSLRGRDPIVCAVLLAPSAAIFIIVGLTGQSVLTASFCGNGMFSLLFPGIIYGIFMNSQRGFRNANFVV